MKYIIDKSFDFCYGHRVHNQRLDTNFTESGDACLACRHLHGHQGKVKVFLEADEDNINVRETGMVTDFKHLGWFKNFIDDTLDHKFIMDLQDPLITNELPHYTLELDINKKWDVELSNPCLIKGMNTGIRKDKLFKHKEGFYTLDLNYLINNGSPTETAIFEKYEGMIFVDFVPTSENLTAWLLSVVQNKMKDLPNVKVKAVEYWETPKSHCRVEA